MTLPVTTPVTIPVTGVEPIARTAARVLLVDPVDRVLLFRGHDPAGTDPRSYWFTVGGGLEPGESPAEGACRETFEETGVRLAPADLVGPLWHEVTDFPFDAMTIRQSQDFFLARCAAAEVDTSGFCETEIRSVEAHRWWTLEELASTEEEVYPVDLADRLRALLTGGVA